MRTCDGNGNNDDDTEDDNVIVDNIEIMLIRCLVIEPGRSLGREAKRKCK